MVYETDQEKQCRRIIEQLQKSNITLSNDDQKIITEAVREAYLTGYADGQTDEKDISEHPISG